MNGTRGKNMYTYLHICKQLDEQSCLILLVDNMSNTFENTQFWDFFNKELAFDNTLQDFIVFGWTQYFLVKSFLIEDNTLHPNR